MLSLLPFAGKAGESRPIAFSQPSSHPYHNFKSPEELYRYLDEEFPQMEARKRLSAASASAWCTGKGSTFPSARWCNKASTWIGGAGVALLGDSLHCFPPDLGQGVNAGMSDIMCLLDLWPEDTCSRDGVKKCLQTFSDKQAPEAEAICKLLPIGMPYQYNLPHSFEKFSFFASFLIRMLAWKAAPSVFYPPVVFQVTQAPPVKYTEVLKNHHTNNFRLALSFVAATCGTVAVVSLWRKKS